MGLTDYEQVWEQNRQAGEKALQQGKLAEAEEHYRVTVWAYERIQGRGDGFVIR